VAREFNFRSIAHEVEDMDFSQPHQVGTLIALVAVAGGMLIPILWVIGEWAFKLRRLHIEASLKQQMIEQGMSADDIVKVLKATSARKAENGTPEKLAEEVEA
jgi:hypothetical protein